MENKTDLIERLRKIANELEQDLKPEFDKEELLKEANKRFPIGTKYTGLNSNTKWEVKGILDYFNSNGKEYITDGWGGIVYDDKIWATVIKERSFEDWYEGWCDSGKSLKNHIKSTKTELIEILNNLPND